MLAKDDTKTIVLEGSKLVYVDERQTKSCTKINYRCKKGCPASATVRGFSKITNADM